MNPEVQQAINNINQYIVENHNNEITANILNPILIELANLFDLVGDLSDLNTTDKDSVVDAINEAISLIAPGAQIHTGTADPNVTPPETYAVGDLYSRLTIGGDPYQIYMFNGVEWGEIKRFINDAITSNEYSWSSQKIADAILGNRLLNSPTIVIDENDITISDLQWVINGNTYILSPAFTDTIPYTSEAGKVRTDIIVGIQANELLRIEGVEGDVAVSPAVPENTVLVTTIDVFHDSLGEVEPPIEGGQYVKKMGYKYIYNESGVVESEIAYPLAEDRRNYVILSWNTTEKIAGFSLSSAYGGDTVYNGMIVTIDNQTANPVVLLDNGVADVKFDFRAGISEYTMKPGEVLVFKLRVSTLVLLSSNKAETDNITLEKARQNGNVLEGDVIFDSGDTRRIQNEVGAELYFGEDGVIGLKAFVNSYTSIFEVKGSEIQYSNDDPSSIGIVGNQEFDKQGDRKAFAQIADLEDALVDYVPTADVGVANGVAPTDSNNKIPLSFLPDAILGQVVFGGTVVPATGVATLSTNAKTKLGTTDATITLTNDTTPITGYEANEGIYYIAFDEGTFGGISLEVGDWLISTGSNWTKIDNTDAVTMVNGKTGAVTLNSEDIPYDNTTSGLLAENVQELGDELQANIEQEITDRQLAIETAGFVQRTGTEIHFDKWATYGTYDTPVSGNLSYSFTNMVKGMIQVMYHEDMSAPTVLQAGVTVIQSGDYVVENLNKITVHCIDENVIEVNIKAL